ncbi:MAG: aminoacyl-tRNA hydrolase, partial [Pseudomonadota bacterium]
LRSIVAQYAQDFVRVRIGIGHPGHKDRVAGYVLNDFAKADNVWIVPMLDAISDNADALLREDLNAFQSAIGNAVAGTSSGDRSAASKSSAQSTGTAPQRLRKPDSSRAPGRKAPAASGRNVGDTTGRTRNRPSQTDLARRASGSGSGSSASKAPQHRPAKSEAAPPQSDAQTSTDATPSFAQRLANFFNSNDKSR